jgi:exosortase
MIKRRILVFAFFVALLVFYFPTLRALFSLAWSDDSFSHILIVPFISGYFFFEKRKAIVDQRHYSFGPGSILLLAGIIAWILQMLPGISILYGSLSMKTVSMVIAFIGGAVCLLGTQVFKSALFPMMFLILIIPLPSIVLNKTISFYQNGTAAVADTLFKLSGMTYFRDGLSFHFSNLSINIAPQCSGIRSSTALIITGIIAGHLFLRTLAGKTVFILLTIPLALVKNGIRVATLSLLGIFVNKSFISGDLHHKGGFVFFIIALGLLLGGMFVIKKIEKRKFPVVRNRLPVP